MRKLLLSVICIVTSLLSCAQSWDQVIQNIPMVKYDYPASRNRQRSPTVSQPRAWVFAYYNLPYAIDLDLYEDATGGYGSKVIVKFSNCDLIVSEERKILERVLPKLQALIDELGEMERMARRNANYNSVASQAVIAAQGNVIIAFRERQCANHLYTRLVNRLNALR